MIDFHFDFETRSRADLRKVGVVKYAIDPSTEATLLTWCFGRTGRVKAWRYGQPIPKELVDVIVNPEKYLFNAYNIEFDYCIWVVSWSRQLASQGIYLKRPGIKNIVDTMARSNRFRTGGSLDATAKMLNLPVTKDKDGRRIMLKQCKPNGRTGEFPELKPEEWEKFERYGIIDTVLLRDIYYMIPPLPAAERWTFEWNFRRNLTGIKLDLELLDIMKKIIDHYSPKIHEEFTQITGLKVKSPKCKDWFKPYFPWIENMQADTIRDMNKEDNSNKPAHVVRALELKTLAGSTSVAKIDCAHNMQHDGRVYGILEYHKAQTKRFAGKGVQIQNFARPVEGVDKLPEDMNIKDLAGEVIHKAPTLDDPINYAKNLLRRIWIADEGEFIYCGDFSKVEPTVLYWLTGKGDVPDNVYEVMAGHIYSVPPEQISKDSEERTVGKSAFLGGGYGMGYKKFMDDTFKKTGITLDENFSKHVINTYRKVNHEISGLWKLLQAAFVKAINGEGSTLCNEKIYVMPMLSPWKGVQIRLPSGSYLYYHNAYRKVVMEDRDVVEIINGMPVVKKVKRANEAIFYMTDMGRGQIGPTKIYGGLLTEHVTSAIARDLLCYAAYNLEQAGFKILTTIHDELWGSSYAGREEEFNSTMCILPSWCRDLKVTADLKCGVRYLK